MTVPITTPEMQPENAPTRGLNILVLDDSEVDRKTVIRLCNKAGLNAVMTEADTLDAFRRALDQTSYDLIFIDYLLGSDTGLDAINILSTHNNQPSAAAIMIAAEGHVDIAVEAMRRGCADYLTKSMLTVDSLQKSIATAFERKAIMAQLADESRARMALEQSIRRYADASTAEMRHILSATMRRVRLMRRHKAGPDYARDLGTLETDIDRLWETLPKFKERVSEELSSPPARKALH